MRDLKELYNILLEDYKKTTSANRAVINHGGYVCNVIFYLKEDKVITEEEYWLLFDHFLEQRPTEKVNIEFYNSPICNKPREGKGSVWFHWYDSSKPYKDNTQGINIRIALLESIISKL